WGEPPSLTSFRPPRTAQFDPPPPKGVHGTPVVPPGWGEGGGRALSPPSLVDACFASHAAGLDVFIAGPAALDGASEILARGGVAGSRVFLACSSRKIAS
ncbi:MAG: hypothetical protein WBQ53_11535, partial [Methylocystis sp.]